jgi:molybdopterin converting factor small subunit
MEIHLKCFASLSEGDECDFRDSTSYEINPGETVDDLIGRIGFPKQEIKLVFVNNRSAGFDTVLKEGDRIALSPPVGGM